MTTTGPVWAIIVAAGQASRYGRRKLHEPLGGHRVIDWPVAAAVATCDGVVVVVAGGSGDDSPMPPGVVVVEGGPTRSDSVRRGLAAVPAAAEVVLVHDGARALASPRLFRAVIAAVGEGAAGVAPALPVRDALKRVEDGRVTASVDREQLVAVQTPQGFAAEALREAHAGGAEAADDLELIERLGHRTVVIDGEEQARKLTVREDLVLLDAMARCLGGWAPEDRP